MTDLLARPADQTLAFLGRRVASVTLRLADVLERDGVADSGAAEAATYLRGCAAELRDGAPHSDEALRRVVAAFGLTDLECDLLVLAGLADEHEGIAAIFRSLDPNAHPSPTVGLAAMAFADQIDRHHLRSVLVGGAATRQGILRLGGGPFFERPMFVADGLWDALHGCDGWPADLPRADLGECPAGLDGWVRGAAADRARRAVRADRRIVVVIQADDPAVAAARCVALAASAGRSIVAARLDPSDGSRVAALALHAVVRGGVPVAVVDPSSAPPVAPSLTAVPGAIMMCAAPGTVRLPTDRAVAVLRADPVDRTAQLAAWSAALPGFAGGVEALAARYPLDPAVTAQLSIDANGSSAAMRLADVAGLIRERAAAGLPPGARLLTANVAWDRLVLPDESVAQLREAVARLDHQAVVLDQWGLRDSAGAGQGTRLLLVGPPGTGKSFAAAVVASAANTALLVVDVAQIVSKWLGETEKNLGAIFDAAERTQAILLLDEADALFASRTEVSDAHDRYANLETAYLLQRLDDFSGAVVLTSNLRGNIDPAFVRRMDFVVQFPLPDVASRAKLWARYLPEHLLGDGVDLAPLARLYAVPGAWIRNAAIAAAFAAAADGTPIDERHLLAAMRREYAKAASPFPGEPPRRHHEPGP